jgi:bifunctional DNA-binding transcriptional regulator/antitoxin component of YhaV-PrlF toxin-antitoxin module
VLLRPKRQMTIPKDPCEDAGLAAGDRLRVRADGPGRILLERINFKEDQAAGEQAPV